MTDASPVTLHSEHVPNAAEFAALQRGWREQLAADDGIRRQAVDLQVAADSLHFTYQWQWLGVPIIRLPDDIVALQELVWEYRPTRIVETGVARGGSIVLNASLQILAGIEPAVLGIDISIFDHTRQALATHPLTADVELLEADSTSPETRTQVADFIGAAERALLVLDSNHTHGHVLAELRSLAPLLPVGGFVLVADTLVEEFPEGHYANRPWDRGDNPLTALRAFLAEDDRFEEAPTWSRRGLMTEFRDGVLRRTR